MGMETLEKAINNYRGITTEDDEHDEGAIVCKCFGVTDTKIKRAIRENNLNTVEEITFYTKAGGGCGACKVKLEDILNDIGIVQPVNATDKSTSVSITQTCLWIWLI